MPGVQKHMQNARIAAAKAQSQRVYISGLSGQQSLETGVAYHYRGHYLYAYPAGTPIEPVPFSTKKGINIIGIVQDVAPIYSPNAPGLVPESSIAALNKSLRQFAEDQKEQEEASKRDIAQAIQDAEQAVEDADMEMPVVVRPGPSTRPAGISTMGMTPLIPAQVSSRGPSRGGSQVPLPAHALQDARSNTGHSAFSVATPSTEQPLRSDQAFANVRHGVEASAGELASVTNPSLHRFVPTSEDLASMATSNATRKFQRYPSDASSMLDTDLGPAPRWSSHASLPSLTVKHNYGESSSPAGPGLQNFSLDPSRTVTPALSRSTSRLGSRSGLANMTIYDGEAYYEDLLPSISTGPGLLPFSRFVSPAATPAISRTVSHTALHDSYRAPSSAAGANLRTSTSGANLRSSTLGRSHPSAPSLNREPSAPQNEGYIFGTTLTPTTSWNLQDFAHTRTPHDRALYLADSAPGSRLPSRVPSRAPSPDRYLSIQGQHASPSVRHVASVLRLPHLAEEGRPNRTRSPLEALEAKTHFPGAANSSVEDRMDTNYLTEEWMDPDAVDAFVATVSRPASPPAFSRPPSPPAMLISSPPTSRNKPIGTGRPRRASQLLNQAHNAGLERDALVSRDVVAARVPSISQLLSQAHNAGLEREALGSRDVVAARLPKCLLHGEGCDGVTVTGTYKTQWARENTGFVEGYPMVVGEGEGDRVMVDWAGLVREEVRGVRG